ncbi:YkgJ family cysteine cluster protein [Urbifossiella limnaea]|uniref:Flagellin N-methylase n=1 Tax=Urbifossiella limnaea TaxID=2528023 RepID=A0A517XNL8_9BACT|nr:YkgJ family cysteine cluster protein [Urbifossiella limnaea]QDU19100.1 Flagellin N-methylase [Urbifossiella limnaea]
MALLVRSLPVAQNWDCRGCAACCRSYSIPVSADERKRIEAQNWDLGTSLFDARGTTLNHRPDGACVFLGDDDRCRIHAKFGAAAKPLACRVYPFLLVPAGDHWRVGLRYACPSAAANDGRPLDQHLAEVREYAAQLEENEPAARTQPPPPLRAGTVVPWDDVLRIAGVVAKMLGEADVPMERRWRNVLTLAALADGLKFDGKKPVTGGRLSELFHVLSETAADETPPADQVSRPGRAGRLVFRQVLAVYARKDHGAERGTAQRSALGRVAAAVRFARGSGVVPKLHAALPTVPFAAGEEPFGPLPDESAALLTRYFRLKVQSLQFCGPTNFGVPFWEGLRSLALTFPVAMWLARVFAAGGEAKPAAVLRAVRVTDDNFGFNRLLGMGRQKFALRLLAARDDLPRLTAWYGQ